jgi:hypothetical protein
MCAMKAALMWFLRLVTGRREPARCRLAELHQAMGRMPDGSSGGFVFAGVTDVTFVSCKATVAWPWPAPSAN